MDKKLERAITYILRYAIAEGGRAYYNPCMYNLGFADNIPPSDEFNRELCKFGQVHYERYFDSDFEESLNVAIECIEWFSKTFKKYPYKTIATEL